ncbi:hypothetical protein BC941DRAFT_434380 [Chlamydoabsidia padenii]|nr:hypothetical protein BC941DRAFT_434380 [Chlamydoabsidia padenii]
MWGIKHFFFFTFLLVLYPFYPRLSMTNHHLKDNDLDAAVTVIEGQLPLIISVPHGSLQLPSTIPNRTSGQLIADAYTISVGQQLSQLVEEHYNASPYVVILNVARRKVDVNRPMDQSCESTQGKRIWKHYHNVLQKTVDTVKKTYGHGLLLDIHGQAHKEGMVELGYLLTSDTLRSTKKEDSTLIQQSSLQSLAARLDKQHASSLLRGNGSFGYAMMMGQHDVDDNQQLSIQVVPSPAHTAPTEHSLYFFGGYTTERYHTTLDVIQVETPKVLRFSKQGRKLLCDRLAQAAIFMLDHYYLRDKSKL